MLDEMSFGNSLWTNYGTLNVAVHASAASQRERNKCRYGVPSPHTKRVSELKRNCSSFLLFAVKPSFTDFHWEIIFMYAARTHTSNTCYSSLVRSPARWRLCLSTGRFVRVSSCHRHSIRLVLHCPILMRESSEWDAMAHSISGEWKKKCIHRWLGVDKHNCRRQNKWLWMRHRGSVRCPSNA